MSKNRLTIGLPVYNGAKHLRPLMDSVLAQTYGDFDFLISDNASTDATQEICRDYAARDKRVKYSRNVANIGAAKNYNKVFHERTSEEYFKWVAHDDVLMPTYFEKTIELMDDAPRTVSLCFPLRKFIDDDGAPVEGGTYCYNNIDDLLIGLDRVSFLKFVSHRAAIMPQPAFAMTRVSALKKTRLLGGYWGADRVMCAELRLAGEFRELQEVLWLNRLHAQTQDWQARQTKRGDAVWFDPANQDKPISPNMKLVKEHLVAIANADCDPVKKVGYFLAMGGYFGGRFYRMLKEGRFMFGLREEWSVFVEKLPLLGGKEPQPIGAPRK